MKRMEGGGGKRIDIEETEEKRRRQEKAKALRYGVHMCRPLQFQRGRKGKKLQKLLRNLKA